VSVSTRKAPRTPGDVLYDKRRRPRRQAQQRALNAQYKDLRPVPATLLDWVVVDRISKGHHPGARRPSHYELVAADWIMADRGPDVAWLLSLATTFPPHWITVARRYCAARGVTGRFLADAMHDDWLAAQLEGMTA
jgi:hypothetical protein